MMHATMEIQTTGRWGGRLTSRDLPTEDHTLQHLSLSERQELARHWLERSASERRVGTSFTVIRDTLIEVQARDELVELASRAIDDEARHAEIARVVASRFWGEELPAPPLLPFSAPEHRGASRRLTCHLWVVGQCSLNETFASAVLEASLAHTTAGLAKAALRELLSDEIDHARIGWAHLAGLDAAQRGAIQPRLLSLTRANVKMWRDTPRLYPSSPALVEQGALSRELIEGALLAAVRELVAPGFAALGFDVSPIVRWLDSGAPT